MASLQLTTTLMGIGLAALILYLIRRDHLYVMHGLFWVFVASAAAFLGIWPGLIDKLAGLAGISYPPALLLLLACIVLLVKALHSDMVNTRIERDVRRLNQRLALLQADIEAQRVAAEPSTSREHLSVCRPSYFPSSCVVALARACFRCRAKAIPSSFSV